MTRNMECYLHDFYKKDEPSSNCIVHAIEKLLNKN
jgi:hypothetical protein